MQSGEVEARARTGVVATIGPGDSFGEDVLLEKPQPLRFVARRHDYGVLRDAIAQTGEAEHDAARGNPR